MTLAQTADVSPTSLTETYGQWVVRCVTPAAAEGAEPTTQICEMSQELRQRETNQRVLAVSLQQRKEEGASLTIVAPFGLLLSEGVKIEVGEVKLLNAAFRTCLSAGCVAVADLAQADIDVLAAGETATVLMADTNNQELRINVSLTGFTAAWNRLKGMQN